MTVKNLSSLAAVIVVGAVLVAHGQTANAPRPAREFHRLSAENVWPLFGRQIRALE